MRLLAAIVSDLWKRKQNLAGENAMIHSGMINFSNLNALSGQLKKLYGNGYDSVISADVSGAASNAFKIDSSKPEYGRWDLTQSISTVILLNSFGNEGPNKGVSVPELKLNLLSPNGFNHNNINGALDELESNAYYLYYAQSSSSGKRYWFHVKPNINILINQSKGDIRNDDITSEIINRIEEKVRNIRLFNVLVNPSEDIPEQTRPTLLILSPKYLANPDGVNGGTLPIIKKIATKKGNSERIYRNTMLFMVCSELGISQLNADIREYLACKKINLEYKNQLEQEQKQDLKSRMDGLSRSIEKAIVTAYSIVVKYAAKTGAEVLQIREFKDTIDNQVNYNIIDTLKDEEWLLDSVGANTLKNNNLYPLADKNIRVKDIYEAFIRFDDKPMITGKEAIAKSLQRYCTNGEFCVATGDGQSFTRFFYKETVPFFDVNEDTYWLVDKDLRPDEKSEQRGAPGENLKSPDVLVPSGGVSEPTGYSTDSPSAVPITTFKSVTISGKIPLEHYTQLFNSFIMPLAQNNIGIEIRIKGKPTKSKPLTNTSQEYKIVKESASQLGLDFEEEV